MWISRELSIVCGFRILILYVDISSTIHHKWVTFIPFCLWLAKVLPTVNGLDVLHILFVDKDCITHVMWISKYTKRLLPERKVLSCLWRLTCSYLWRPKHRPRNAVDLWMGYHHGYNSKTTLSVKSNNQSVNHSTTCYFLTRCLCHVIRVACIILMICGPLIPLVLRGSNKQMKNK